MKAKGDKPARATPAHCAPFLYKTWSITRAYSLCLCAGLLDVSGLFSVVSENDFLRWHASILEFRCMLLDVCVSCDIRIKGDLLSALALTTCSIILHDSWC